MSLQALLKHHIGTVISYDGHEFRTQRKLLDMGIGLCSECSSLLPGFPGDNTCPHCGTIAIVVPDIDQDGEPIPKRKVFLPKPFTNPEKKESIRHILELCKICRSHLMFRVNIRKKCYYRHADFRYQNHIKKFNEMQMFEAAKEEIANEVLDERE